MLLQMGGVLTHGAAAEPIYRRCGHLPARVGSICRVASARAMVLKDVVEHVA